MLTAGEAERSAVLGGNLSRCPVLLAGQRGFSIFFLMLHFLSKFHIKISVKYYIVSMKLAKFISVYVVVGLHLAVLRAGLEWGRVGVYLFPA